MNNESPAVAELISALELEPHVEGGYYRRTFEASDRVLVPTQRGERFIVTSIYYLLTARSPIGHWHLNRSDVIHYHHSGGPIHYYMLHMDGQLEKAVLGSNVAAGERPQLTVKGGIWKASHLQSAEYGLISEAVAPGFDFKDMTLGNEETLLQQFPEHQEVVKAYTR